jgi:hypothetical protein
MDPVRGDVPEGVVVAGDLSRVVRELESDGRPGGDSEDAAGSGGEPEADRQNRLNSLVTSRCSVARMSLMTSRASPTTGWVYSRCW